MGKLSICTVMQDGTELFSNIKVEGNTDTYIVIPFSESVKLEKKLHDNNLEIAKTNNENDELAATIMENDGLISKAIKFFNKIKIDKTSSNYQTDNQTNLFITQFLEDRGYNPFDDDDYESKLNLLSSFVEEFNK